MLTPELTQWITAAATLAAQSMCAGQLLGCKELEQYLLETCPNPKLLHKLQVERVICQSHPHLLQEVGILLNLKKHHYLVGFQICLPYGIQKPHYSPPGITYLPHLNSMRLHKLHLLYQEGM